MLGRLQRFGTCFISKTTNFVTKATEKTVYYGKVTAELSKQVYSKEKLQPPTLQDFKTVYSQIWKCGLERVTSPKAAANCISSAPMDVYLKCGAYGIQILGCFALGEVIGRRKLVGYRTYPVVLEDANAESENEEEKKTH